MGLLSDTVGLSSLFKCEPAEESYREEDDYEVARKSMEDYVVELLYALGLKEQVHVTSQRQVMEKPLKAHIIP